VWRTDGDSFVRSWEERFVVDHGYRKNLLEAVAGLAKKTGTTAADFDRAVLYAPDAKSHAQVAKALKLAPERVQDPLFGKVGNCGTAFAPILLTAALENAQAGQKILLAGYGDGAPALALTVEKPSKPAKPISAQVERKRLLDPTVHRRARQLEPESK